MRQNGAKRGETGPNRARTQTGPNGSKDAKWGRIGHNRPNRVADMNLNMIFPLSKSSQMAPKLLRHVLYIMYHKNYYHAF